MTFKSNHTLSNYWVKIIADNYKTAKEVCIARYGGDRGWSMLYREQEFEPEYFPKGEHHQIVQDG